MGIRDRLRKAKRRISDSEGSKRLRGDIQNIKRMAKEHKVKQEEKAEAKYHKNKKMTRRIKAEAQYVRAQNELAKAKGARSSSSSRMRGPFDSPGAGKQFQMGWPFGQGSSFDQGGRGRDLPGLVGGGSFGNPPGTKRQGPRRRKKR